MTLDEKATALNRTALFGTIAPSEQRLLAHHAIVRRLVRGDILFVVEEEAEGMFVIVSGSVRAFRVSSDGREQVIHVEHAGATLAEVPVFDGGAYPAGPEHVQIKGKTVIADLTLDQFVQFAEHALD